MSTIGVGRRVLERNDEIARSNRERLERAGVVTLNLVSSAGSGKTALLEQTLARLDGRVGCAVIAGDVHTDLDARRIARSGVAVTAVETDGACHLEARAIRAALDRLALEDVDLLFIENVGNLVCPAAYDLGESAKVVLLSVAEGEDKPLKYPAMFRNASVLVLTKVDLLPYVPGDLAVARANALGIHPALEVFETSSTTGVGLDAWCDWLVARATGRP